MRLKIWVDEEQRCAFAQVIGDVDATIHYRMSEAEIIEIRGALLPHTQWENECLREALAQIEGVIQRAKGEG